MKDESKGKIRKDQTKTETKPEKKDTVKPCPKSPASPQKR